MKLRSRSSDPSHKGKSIMEDPDNSISSWSSDSDYSESSHEGGGGIGNDELVDVSDSEPPKRRKTGSWSDEEMALEVDDVVVKKNKTKKKAKKKTKPTLMWQVWEEETEKWLDQHMTEDVDLDNLNEIVAETVGPSPDLIMPLLRYQKEWLAWGLKQEESASRGGILADEMGMGKTVQAIALVLAKRALRPSSSSTGVNTTLVICPLIAVMQWVNEIDRFTAKGSNKVLVYHGPNRGKSLVEFSEYDFIVTTYSIVEAEYRKNVMPPKDRCEWCGKMFYAKKLKIHLKYFCGPDAVKTAKQSKQCKKKGKLGEKTSLSKADVSDEEDGEHKSSKKNTKGKRKKENIETSAFPDISSGSGSMKSFLHSVKWDRIILDEAHYIKDRRCNTTRAVFALESSYKWALSGTPLQNRVGELYSLVRFLQITPYSYYMCKDCDCKVLDYSSNSSCPSCPHKSVRHFCWWNKYIANPIANRGRTDDGIRAMILLKDKVLKSILLRRTKKGRAADLALPPRIISLRRDYLDITEKDYYTSLYTESQAQFNTYVEEGTLMNNYAHIFDLLTRLRQAVDHPYLVVYSKTAVARRDETKSTNEQICGICHDVAEDPVVTSCEHLFCKSCLIDFSASYGQPACPTCSKPLTVDFSANNHDQQVQKPKSSFKGFKSSSIINRIRLENFQTSTKIDALKEEIRFMVERDGSAKGIVFSQFTSFLDLIHYSLHKCGVKCVQLDGSMTMGAREAAITKFTDDRDCKVFLMSLKAGGVALNLTVASHVFLMDPWWNPAVEQQAQDRIHRIGQYKPIRVVRFVIENTIEERILNLQEKKKLVFEGTVGGCNEALGRLTEADMRFLFAT
ncbi:putative DNA helicase chromatin remodeling SNF2 family [Helianthus annuus]|uniref:DNA helicase chromatin remodeling SNF2 family n=1 Tax=Helianthus annuus TaxID=4232 RepID=A0A251SIP7_HELAN|nr:DNA repair protein RAD16 isoform X2 [Helianthus annuus]KAF5810036.1 putative DNA helicase chromatin remodeling SNF2 family [Helianthus annuus]KAJ0580942.1 putative DNA helicase chromatin remodeling SNF2 family [Helianthus annuus]KAJ0588692.1 putative DNA helicase chromatin remodeling SNF2 family [Helianthus annuus]KAJ0596883.1 putative DNA helicase chromatin remodeling SNF2 family [Helianthus annuus]KAJ0757562.1 putative DNA helicase chromatin remodeling SNF2 family [Helianthus annuus]